MLLGRLVGQHGHRLGDDGGRVHHGLVDLHLVGFDSRNVEDVIDDAEQVLGGIGDHLQAAFLRRCRTFPAEQVDGTHDAVQRRPDLVAHVGQESALGKIRRVGGFQGVGQFLRAFGDPLFEIVAVVGQLPLAAQALGDVHQAELDQRLAVMDEFHQAHFGIPELAVRPQMAPGEYDQSILQAALDVLSGESG